MKLARSQRCSQMTEQNIPERNYSLNNMDSTRKNMIPRPLKASIIIPAREAMATLEQAVESVLSATIQENVEIIIVNDAADGTTAKIAHHYPVKVIDGNGNGPGSARNIGVRYSSGEILIFLDADCRVSPNWFASHLEAHEHYGEFVAVGGSICLEPDAPFWARCDHYCSWYHANPGLPPSWVRNHPAANLSVSRQTFEYIGPFKEDLPRAGVHEETEWQGRLLRWGGRIRFEPQAVVWHVDRSNPRSYMKHNYRWGYNSLLVKREAEVSRFPWLYKNPQALVACFLVFALVHTIYTTVCWLRVGKWEPLLLMPTLLFGRVAYAAGMARGGIRAIHSCQ
jgi:GT2 family glycosyltransferase